MIRKLLLIFGVLVFGATAASAQSCQDVINKRQDLMKKSAASGKIAAAMIRGQTPFDLAKAKQILAVFYNDASQLSVLFPDCSKTGEHTTVSPAVWEKPAEFKTRIDKYLADVKAAQKSTKDLATFKASIQAIGKDCSSCHQDFRVKRS